MSRLPSEARETMSHHPAVAIHPVAEMAPGGAFAALAAPSPGAEWVAVDAGRLPRQAFDLVIAFADGADGADALADLASLRNALTRDGKLLVVVSAKGAPCDVRDLAVRAGFTRVREIPSQSHHSTLELQR